MKTFLLVLSLAVAGVGTAKAQMYAPAVVNGSILGGIAGAIIGGHNHNRWGEGAAIGAVAGALIGSAVEQPRAVVYGQPPVTVMQSVPTAAYVGQPQVVYVQPAPVVYQPYYAPAYYGYGYGVPVINVGFGWGYGRGWGYGPRGGLGHGFRR